jgi:preprotein translocase subunit SecE
MAKTTNFFKEVGNEVKKVTWPNKEQLQESTIVTLMVCAIITVFVFVADRVFQQVIELIFKAA